MQIAVIGAGVAGLMSARTLQDHGHDVVVFDKARGVGGRTSFRPHASFAFDHGAQYFTARDSRFRRHVEAWIEAGVVAEWKGRIVSRGEEARPSSDSTTRFVGVPGMNAVATHVAESLQVVTRTRVSRIARGASGWRLAGESGRDLGRYDATILALPSAQAEELLTAAGIVDVQSRAPSCPMAPCWAVLLGFDRALDVPFDGAFVNGSPLSWIARNNSKPGRPPGESWVLHTSPEWATRHLESRPEEVIESLTAEFGRITGLDAIQPVHCDAHRWRYALPVEPLKVGCIWIEDARLVVAGDWCSGARVEGAFLSGMAAAGRLLGHAGTVSADAEDSAWRDRHDG
jgi:predicted NAD/FAD-dependent oxidoreductase